MARMAWRRGIGLAAALVAAVAVAASAVAEPPARSAWPHSGEGATPVAEYDPATGRIDVAWQAVDGAAGYVVWWANGADRLDFGLARTAEVSVSLSRNGGFVDGEWKIRVRVAAGGAWSEPAMVMIVGAPPELMLDIESSRDLCTEGTLTEIRWSADGGLGPLSLQVNGEPVAGLSGTVKVNCGVIPRGEDGQIDESRRDAVITGFLRDGRGVTRSASIRVPRAEALPAPSAAARSGLAEDVLTTWKSTDDSHNALELLVLQREMLTSDTKWTYSAIETDRSNGEVRILSQLAVPRGGRVLLQGAVLRHPLEAETPDALRWSTVIEHQMIGDPSISKIEATHDMITVTWLPTPGSNLGVNACSDTVSATGPDRRSSTVAVRSFSNQTNRASLYGLQPDMLYEVRINACSSLLEYSTTATIRTKPAPAGWSELPRGPQNLRATATSTTITVHWEDPFHGAVQLYQVLLIDGDTGASLGIDGAHEKSGATWSYIFAGLAMQKSYRIRVRHHGFIQKHGDITIMTTSLDMPSPPRRQGIPAGLGIPGLDGTLVAEMWR